MPLHACWKTIKNLVQSLLFKKLHKEIEFSINLDGRMAELADAQDLKSWGSQEPWGFDSLSAHNCNDVSLLDMMFLSEMMYAARMMYMLRAH